MLNPKFASEEGKTEFADKEVDEIVQKLMTTIGNMIIGNYAMAVDCQWQEKYSGFS